MIPKRIHYCWFGRGKKSNLMLKCIESWKKHCPDYEIVEWNEDNFDIEKYPYTKYCFENKKWAFLSDFVRLKVVCEQGGIYLDTDVEVIKSFDDLLKYDAFYGFEIDEYVATGLGFGSIPNHKTIRAMIEEYDCFNNIDNKIFNMIGCPTLNTKALVKLGLALNGQTQEIQGAIILSAEYLNPLDDPTGNLNITKNTYSIHWYSKSALSKKEIIRSKITRQVRRIFGRNVFDKLRAVNMK